MPIDLGVSAPAGVLMPLFLKLLPPIIIFGSPCQRAKELGQSYWHVPITLQRRGWIGPGELARCQIYLDVYENDRVKQSVRMTWGDAIFTDVGELATLVAHEVLLVPVASRSELSNDRAVPLASLKRVLRKTESEFTLQSDHRKLRFKLRVKSGKTVYTSPHFYHLRNPPEASNGHFICEIEYEGEGTR